MNAFSVGSELNLQYSSHPLVLGAFAKLRKTTGSFMSVIFVNKVQLGSDWTDFHETCYLWIFFENLSRKLKCHWNLTRITGTLPEDQYTFLIVSRSVLFRMRNVSDKSCRENQNTLYDEKLFFRNLCRLWDNLEKYGRAGQVTCDNMAHANCKLDT
jgi:hypothetical protein